MEHSWNFWNVYKSLVKVLKLQLSYHIIIKTWMNLNWNLTNIETNYSTLLQNDFHRKFLIIFSHNSTYYSYQLVQLQIIFYSIWSSLFKIIERLVYHFENSQLTNQSFRKFFIQRRKYLFMYITNYNYHSAIHFLLLLTNIILSINEKWTNELSK